MNIQVIDGKIQVQNARVGDANVSASMTAYICRPDTKILCRINGINDMSIKAKYIDISEIDFTVSKFVMNETSHKLVKNPCYEYLHAFCCVLVPELGQYGLFRINEEPTINARNSNEETKTFVAYSYDSILQYEYLSGFKVNQGTSDSLEMFDLNLSPSGVPLERIKLYNPEDESLSLLNLVLYDDLYGWEIYYVDPSIADKEASFSVDKKSVYSFLREDVQKAFRCVVDFDTIHKRINVYDIETVGNDTNILLSFNHFVQTIDIKPSTADIYTVFNVAGGNNLDISRVNFGSNKIVNIDYPISFMGDDIQTSYAQYKVFRENKRSEYSELYVEYADYLAQRNSILDRQPSSDIEKNWMSSVYYSLEDLRTNLADYQALVTYIESLYTVDGEIDYETLDISPDAAEYYSYKNVVIPDIQAAIEAREGGSSTAETVDASTQWQLYGLNDLTVKLTAYTNMRDTLAEQGYTRAWSDTDDSISEETWNAHYAEYTSYSGYVTELTALIADRETKLAAINEQISSCETQLRSLALSVSLVSYFGSSVADIITLLYKESDYSDENYLIADYDTESDITAESELLYQAAVERLEVESRPQLSWSISSDSLYAIPEFASLRDSLQNGDYCTIAYGAHNRIRTEKVIETADGAAMSLKMDDTASHADAYYKLRVIEIDFNGLDLNASFGLVFSDVVTTTKGMNDFESLLGDFVSSKTNSIKALTLASSATNASDIANRIIRPQIEALQLQIENLKAQNIIVNDLNAIKITANQIYGGELTLGGANNVDGVMRVYDADGNQVGYWSKDGIVGESGEIGGWTITNDGRLYTSRSKYLDSEGEEQTGDIRTALFAKYGEVQITGKDSDDNEYNTRLFLYGLQTDKKVDGECVGRTRIQQGSVYTWFDDTYEWHSYVGGKNLGVYHSDSVDQNTITFSKYSNLTESDLTFKDEDDPFPASRSVLRWRYACAPRLLAGTTLYVYLFFCGNLFWAHFDTTDGKVPSGLSGYQNKYLTIIDDDDENLTKSLKCAPPKTIRKYCMTHSPSRLHRLEFQVRTDGKFGLQTIVDDSGTGETGDDYMESCDIFWAHIG